MGISLGAELMGSKSLRPRGAATGIQKRGRRTHACGRRPACGGGVGWEVGGGAQGGVLTERKVGRPQAPLLSLGTQFKTHLHFSYKKEFQLSFESISGQITP